MTDIAMLVFGGRTRRQKRKAKTFDGWSNVGAYVVRDILERAGYRVGWTTADAAHQYKVVLVSLTSLFDVYNLIESVAHLTTWQKDKRRFVVVAGGFGLQNVYPLRHWVDFAAFGRAEVFIVDLVAALLAGRDYDSQHVMPLREEIRPVEIAQAPELYPHPVQVGDFLFTETVLGCPLRCNFCHYTHARRWLGSDPSEYVRRGEYSGNAEGLFVQSAALVGDDNPQSRIITGIDGFSERLRYAMNKRISNETLISVLTEASTRGGDWVRYKLYMIGGYPSETDADLSEFIETMQHVRAPGARLIVAVHLTPFRASPLTPSAWLPVNVRYDWRVLANRTIAENGQYRAWFDNWIDGPFQHLMDTIIGRATEQSDELIGQLAISWRASKLRSSDAIEAIERHWTIESYTRAYTVSEQLPTWYLQSYQPTGALERAGARLLRILAGRGV